LFKIIETIYHFQEFWVFPSALVCGDTLDEVRTLRDALISCEPIKAELDRNLKVLLPSQASKKYSLPPDFFSVSAGEIKKEQKLK
jgi:UBX domain-containing protein 6